MTKPIIITVGHGKADNGGYDPGATAFGYEEFKLVREIALQVQLVLQRDYGAQCDLMNYDGDMTLQQRIDALKDDTYDFLAEIHLNAGGGTGVETYYYNGSERSKSYADAICSEVSSALGIKNRGAKVKLGSKGQNYFGIIRSTKPTAVLVECLFIDTESDLEKIKTKDGIYVLGRAIAAGIAKVRGLKTTSTPPADSALAAGLEVQLNDTDLFISSTASERVKTVSGVYYLYDGISFRKRYRICKRKEDCGADIKYVVGYINESDAKK